MWNLLKLRGSRIKESRESLEDLESRGEHINAQWPEVTELSEWARKTREYNHLTEIFLHGRKSS